MISHNPGKSPKLGTPVRILSSQVARMSLKQEEDDSLSSEGTPKKPMWDATVLKPEAKSRTNLKSYQRKAQYNLTPFTSKKDGERNQLRDEKAFKTPFAELAKPIDYKAKYQEEKERNQKLVHRISQLEDELARKDYQSF